MFYAARGNVPPKRHTQHRAPDGALYDEELFGVEGFTGRISLLYHLAPPTRPVGSAGHGPLDEADDGYHHHRLIDAAGVDPHGDAVTGRIPLFFNSDVVMGVLRPADAMPEGVSTATARPTSCSTSTRAPGCSTPTSGRSGTAPATTWSCRSARPGVSSPTAAAPSGCSTSSARRRSSRPSGIATTTASCSSTRRTRSATSGCRTMSRHGRTTASSRST